LYFGFESQVLEAHVTKHLDSGKVKGAFITFETQDDLARALALHSEVSFQQEPQIVVALARICDYPLSLM
jgi:hypothetical protein